MPDKACRMDECRDAVRVRIISQIGIILLASECMVLHGRKRKKDQPKKRKKKKRGRKLKS